MVAGAGVGVGSAEGLPQPVIKAASSASSIVAIPIIQSILHTLRRAVSESAEQGYNAALSLRTCGLGVIVVLNVRLATQSDRSEALRLARGLLTELGGNPAPADALFGVFDELVSGRDAGFVVIAEEDGVAKAVCTASMVCAIRTAGRYVILQEMYVEPESRNSGVGRAVIDFALEHAVASGCQVVELGTPRNGQRQIEFYERAGFVNVGARLRWATPDNRFR